ncbi:GGDEF domain-containing protein [Actinotalea sp. M2MS4P-6]|uniref:GGDEF domain-containing protein n=1 Tax=Actinotalea sp. M2MS4P-6 TaxID=2983762 RepID=UPI0021E375DE|nr:GGDEF domain-containing protein [Actinotalea sp. M2MS4P-6]MCV2393866.1 GGDEF domain-containing protein [Actinotalea sp. M2MS4P-6]
MSEVGRRRVAGLAWVVAAGYVVLLVASGTVPSPAVTALGLSMAWLPPAVAWFGTWRAPRSRGLRVVAAGLTFFAAGLVLNGATYVSRGVLPFPTPGEPAFVAFYVLMAVGLVLHLRPRLPRMGFVVVLDAAITVLAIATVLSLRLATELEAAHGLTVALLATLAYPFADLALLAAVLGLITITPGALRGWGWLAAGLSLYAVSDIAYVLVTASTPIASWLLLGWALGMMAVAQWVVLAAGAPPPVPRDRHADGGESRRAARSAALSGGIAALAVLTVVVSSTTGPIGPLTAALAATTTLGAAARTQLAFRGLLAVPRLRAQARTDDLTGLPNRRELTERAARVLGGDSDHPHAVLVLDLDGFKQVNDTRGHHAGDVLLAEAARRISASVRLTDVVARTGGDEFAVLMPDATAHVAIEAARRIRLHFAGPVMVDGAPAELSTSIGIALHPEHGWDMATLLRRADEAMYAAKAAHEPYRMASPEPSASP